MRVNPISEEEAEAQSSNLLVPGTYDYEIRDASEETSAAGNEMIKVEAIVFDRAGGRCVVFDYLVGSEKAAWKIRHFAASCGLLEQYEKGSLIAPEIIGRTGKCVIATRPARDQYSAQNTIRDYVKAAGAPARSAAPSSRKPVHAGAGSDLDDEIPF